jgi:hypothetical protein
LELETLQSNPPNSVEDAVRRTTKQISFYNKDGCKTEIVQYIKVQLVQTLTYLGSFDIATEYQVRRMAERIFAVAWMLTIPELEYFFQSFCDGAYGKLYGGRSVNPQDITSALQKYLVEVQQARGEAERERQKQADKEATKRMHETAISYEEYLQRKGKMGDTPNPLQLIRDSFKNQ